MTLQLPALRGQDSLGFLAAVGLLSLSEQGEIPPLRLGWRGGAVPVAVVDGPASIERLGNDLQEAVSRLRSSGGVIPGVDPGFPLPSQGSGRDPMRMPRDGIRRYYREAQDAWLERRDIHPARWLIALAAQTAVRDGGDVELTPFYAPTGQMKLRGSIFERTMEAVERIGGPADALVGWRRTSFDGANFDERAVRDAAVTTQGGAENQGAPSPTWLAAMGMRFFPLVDDGHHAETVSWRRIALYPGYTRRTLIWPVWEPLLDPPAVRALLAHPAMNVVQRQQYEVVAERPRELQALGVTALFGASRRTRTSGDGPLGPGRRIWSAT